MPPTQVTVDANATDLITARNAVINQLAGQYPGSSFTILSETLIDGKYHSLIGISENKSATLTEPEKKSTYIPNLVILISGDSQWNGDPLPPFDAGKPAIVPTRGDSVDHKLIDPNWSEGVQGHKSLWTASLSIKYRTSTLAIWNPASQNLVINQGDNILTCHAEDATLSRQDIIDCLSDSE